MSLANKNQNWIWGFHSVEAALENYPEIITELLLETESTQSDSSLEKLAQNAGVKLNLVKNLPKVLTEKRTQGVAARISEFPEKNFSEIEELFFDTESPGQWVLLDGIQDPRNFGAIIRSAAAFGVRGIFYGQRNQTPPSGLVSQASAGNLFRVPLVSMSSFQVLWKALENAPFRVLALDAEGVPISQIVPSAREKLSVLWVLGSEGEGLRPGIRDKCQGIASIPIREEVESLNASVAASLAFYIAQRKIQSGVEI